MIQIEKITEIPDLDWSTQTLLNAPEIMAQGTSIMKRTEEAYLLSSSDGPILIVGLMRSSMISGWHMWCLICKCDLKRHCRVLRIMLHTLVKRLGHLQVTVDKSFTTGLRFAEFFGFEHTTDVESIDRKTYSFYEMDKAWLTR
jgi:hypothetical protein